MDLLGSVHFAAALASIALGAVVLVIPGKGNRRHRRLGWAYAVAMLTVNATAFLIYDLFGGFGPFHVAALVSLLTIVMGVPAGRASRLARERRDPTARAILVERHYYWMTWSYVGLLAAAVSEAATRTPLAHGAAGPGGAFAVAAATLVVIAAGSLLIRSRATPLLAPFRHRGRNS